MASVPLNHLKLIRVEDTLSLYQWNTHTATPYFCQICGIYTHHPRRSTPDEYAFNLAYLDDRIEIDEAQIVQLNGVDNSLVSK